MSNIKESLVKLAHDKPELRAHLVPLLREAGGYVIGPGGLEKPKKTDLKPNTIHYMGASSSPSLVVVTKVSDDRIEFLNDKGRSQGEQRWIAEDLIYKGDATWLKKYASYVTKYDSWKAVMPGTKVDPKKFFRDRERGYVVVEAVAAASKFPRGDAWYGAEEYGGVGGVEKDGKMLYEINTTRGQADELAKDKRFKVVGKFQTSRQSLNNKQKVALLDHHLCACRVELEDGDLRRCYIQPPDVAFFEDEVRRHF